jgi:hypothetical protein
VSWSTPESATIAFNVDVTDFQTNKLLPDVDVSICNHTDPDCSSPLNNPKPAQTDMTGRVVLQVPEQNGIRGGRPEGLVTYDRAAVRLDGRSGSGTLL